MFSFYIILTKISTPKLRNIVRSICDNSPTMTRGTSLWIRLLQSHSRNFGLVTTLRMPAGRNYSICGFRTALSALCVAVGNTIRSRDMALVQGPGHSQPGPDQTPLKFRRRQASHDLYLPAAESNINNAPVIIAFANGGSIILDANL